MECLLKAGGLSTLPSAIRPSCASPIYPFQQNNNTAGNSNNRTKAMRRVTAAAQPIPIVRSTSVPGQLAELRNWGSHYPDDAAAAATRERALTPSCLPLSGPLGAARSLGNSSGAIAVGRRRAPGAPLMVGSLPPVYALEEMEELVLPPPQGGAEEREGYPPLALGSLCASYTNKRHLMGLHVLGSSCPAAMWSSTQQQQQQPPSLDAAHQLEGGLGGGTEAQQLTRTNSLRLGSLIEEHGFEDVGSEGGSSSSCTACSLTVMGMLEALGEKENTHRHHTAAQERELRGEQGARRGSDSDAAAATAADCAQPAGGAAASLSEMFEMDAMEGAEDAFAVA